MVGKGTMKQRNLNAPAAHTFLVHVLTASMVVPVIFGQHYAISFGLTPAVWA